MARIATEGTRGCCRQVARQLCFGLATLQVAAAHNPDRGPVGEAVKSSLFGCLAIYPGAITQNVKNGEAGDNLVVHLHANHNTRTGT